MRFAIYIDFLSLPSRRPRCERFRVNVTKTSILGAHQESISIDKGQLTFCLTSSYIRSPWNCVGRFPQGGGSQPFSNETKSGFARKLTILSVRCFFSQRNPTGRIDQYFLHSTGYIMDGFFLSLLIAIFNFLSVDNCKRRQCIITHT